MKALCINGSPHENGSTGYIISKIAQGMRESETEVVTYCLGQEQLSYCLGCKKCYEKGECIQQDSMDKIIADFKEADIIVVGTPDYWGDVSGQLKVFFDRCTPYANTNANRIPMPKKRYGISVSVREGTTERENSVIVKSIEHYFGHMEVEPVGSITVTQTSTLDNLLENHKEKVEEAYTLGKTLKKTLLH